MSSFAGLNTALTALYAHRRGLDVTGQNVANANTEGYTRQRVVLDSLGAPAIPALWATWRGAGSGVGVSDVERLRDVFLESRAHTEHERAAYLAGQQTALARVEQVFAEPADTGIAGQLADFWAAWGDLVNRPGDLAARAALLERGATVADSFRQGAAALEAQWTAVREQLSATVDSVNTAAASVAELNQAIRRAEQAGLPANELADRRDLLVVQLADAVGARARQGEDGTVDVYLGGTALVRGAQSETLTLAGATELSGLATDPVTIRWTGTGFPADAAGGSVGAMRETLADTVPRYLARLDAVAADLAGRVNAQHAAGYDLAGAPGGTFFAGSTAASLGIALTDPAAVAAAGVPGGGLDGSNADLLARLAADPTGPDSGYRRLVVDLGVEAQTVNRRVDIQGEVTAQVDAAREAAAGVNLDEEMVNLLAFQRAYEGAARVMTTVDATLDTLINRTGLVGR